MTVAYIQYTHTSSKIGVFFRVLRIWKGGVFKGVWRELLLFCVLYAFISLVYRLALVQNEVLKEYFETFCLYCGKYSHRIPLSFILGFYVSQVVTRWRDQWSSIAWPDRLAQELTANVTCRTKRRCVIRWACLANVIILRMLSSKVALRFPTLEHLVEAGLLTPKELKKLDNLLDKTGGRHDISWLPIQWAIEVLRQARAAGEIQADVFFGNLQKTLCEMAASNWKLYCSGWVSIPLVYTQLVTIAVYAYFLASLFGSQFIKPTLYMVEGWAYHKAENQSLPTGTPKLYNKFSLNSGNSIDVYVPLFTILEFIFYFGWLKVAESLINPFGEDDDDFETNYIIDRNLQVGYMMVEGDEVEVDDPWGESQLPPDTLPHTVSSACHKDEGPKLPTDDYVLYDDDMMLESEGEETGLHSKSSLVERLSALGRDMSVRNRRQHSVKSSVSHLGRLSKMGLEERLSRTASIYSGSSVFSGMSRTTSKKSHHSREINRCRAGEEKLQIVPEVEAAITSEPANEIADNKINCCVEKENKGVGLLEDFEPEEEKPSERKLV